MTEEKRKSIRDTLITKAENSKLALAPFKLIDEINLEYFEGYLRRVDGYAGPLSLQHWTDHLVTKTLLEDPQVSGSVLDVGCFTCEIGVILKQQKPDISLTLVDPCEVALEHGLRHIQEHNIKDVHLIWSQGELLPFIGKYFDACYCSHVLEHIEDALVVIQEIGRVLKENGILYIFVPHEHSYDEQTHVHYWTLEEFVEYISPVCNVLESKVEQDQIVVKCSFIKEEVNA